MFSRWLIFPCIWFFCRYFALFGYFTFFFICIFFWFFIFCRYFTFFWYIYALIFSRFYRNDVCIHSFLRLFKKSSCFSPTSFPASANFSSCNLHFVIHYVTMIAAFHWWRHCWWLIIFQCISYVWFVMLHLLLLGNNCAVARHWWRHGAPSVSEKYKYSIVIIRITRGASAHL